MRFDVLGTVNDPGTPGKTGDDRFGHDGTAGWAWVLDGATDVSRLRPFPRHESGAAWFAETLSQWLMMNVPAGTPDEAYWRSALIAMRDAAERDSDLPLDTLPLEASPIASGMTVYGGDGDVAFHWLGDCAALVDTGDGASIAVGALDKQEAETEDARKVLAMSEADRMAFLCDQRAGQNTPGRWTFGLDPAAAPHVETKRLKVSAGSEIMLMSDGLYRLIDPYGSHTIADIFALARSGGMMDVLQALREQEGAGSETAKLRIKSRDDACGLWLRIET